MAEEGTAGVEERIGRLEEDQLKIAKVFGKQTVSFFFTLAGMRVATLNMDKYKKRFEGYIRFKLEEAGRYIGGAKNVEEVMTLVGDFNSECSTYAEKLTRK